MDNSPSTGSVNTTTAEKQRLAKSSLAFSCKNAAFRQMFPEYVEKYNQQQVDSEGVSLQTSSDESSGPILEKVLASTEDMKRVDPLKDLRKNRSNHFWLG